LTGTEQCLKATAAHLRHKEVYGEHVRNSVKLSAQ